MLTQVVPELKADNAWKLFGDALGEIGIRSLKSYKDSCDKAKWRHNKALSRAKKSNPTKP